MYEDIRSNKIKTGVIVSLFILIITLIIYYICMAFDLGIISIIIALSVSIITAWASYYNSDKIILSISKARPATKEENQKLVNILDALVVSSGIRCYPKVICRRRYTTKCFCNWSWSWALNYLCYNRITWKVRLLWIRRRYWSWTCTYCKLWYKTFCCCYSHGTALL